MTVLSTSDPCGSVMKVLGVKIDSKLLMREAVHQIVVEAAWRKKSLLRTARYHTDAELITLFKSHVVGYVEYRTPAVYHASSSVLAPVDRILDVDPITALHVFNIAPLSARRDIAMLGVIHRSVLGQGPRLISKCFIKDFKVRRVTRASGRAHSAQLVNTSYGGCLLAYRRSIFGLIEVYNALPQRVVDSATVSEFQRACQELLKEQTESRHWLRLFSPHARYGRIIQFA